MVLGLVFVIGGLLIYGIGIVLAVANIFRVIDQDGLKDPRSDFRNHMRMIVVVFLGILLIIAGIAIGLFDILTRIL